MCLQKCFLLLFLQRRGVLRILKNARRARYQSLDNIDKLGNLCPIKCPGKGTMGCARSNHLFHSVYRKTSKQIPHEECNHTQGAVRFSIPAVNKIIVSKQINPFSRSKIIPTMSW